MRKLFFIFLIAIFIASCSPPASTEAPVVAPVESTASGVTSPTTAFTLTSDAFGEGQPIPEKYTCKGDDTNPSLSWVNPPIGTQSFALVMDDPDAPGATWTHWVVYNIPPEVTSLEETTAGNGQAGIGAFGLNSWNRTDYGGPCPPFGTHRYFFKLYALDNKFEFVAAPSPKDLLATMEGHILAEADLMGKFSK